MLTIQESNRNLGGVSDPLASHLVSVQELYVRMFFCDELQREWSNDADAVLARFKLSGKHRSWLPPVDSEEFRAECHGRRTLVARELMHRFPLTFSIVLGEKASIDKVVRSDFFNQFISSDSYLTNKLAMQHQFAIGKGYGTTSKLFLWARERLSGQPTVDAELWHTLHVEFAKHLIRQAPHAEVPYLRLPTNGVAFMRPNTKGSEWTIVTVDGTLVNFTLTNSSALHKKGIFVLDSIDRAGEYRAPQGEFIDFPK